MIFTLIVGPLTPSVKCHFARRARRFERKIGQIMEMTFSPSVIYLAWLSNFSASARLDTGARNGTRDDDGYGCY